MKRLELTFFSTAGDADGMVLHHVVVEEEVEPVGIAELSLTEVGVFRRLSVGEAELTCLGIVGIDELIHGAVYSGVGGVGE